MSYLKLTFASPDGTCLVVMGFEDGKSFKAEMPVDFHLPPGSTILVERVEDPLVEGKEVLSKNDWDALDKRVIRAASKTFKSIDAQIMERAVEKLRLLAKQLAPLPLVTCICGRSVAENSPRNKNGARRCSAACIEKEENTPHQDPGTLAKILAPKIQAKIAGVESCGGDSRDEEGKTWRDRERLL